MVKQLFPLDIRHGLALEAAMITGAQIKRARESVNETQAEFAKRFGVDQSAVSDWERRGPPPRGPGRKAIENELDGLKKAKKPNKPHVSRETMAGRA